MTPLVIAALRDHMEIVTALLAHRDIEKNTQCLEGYLNRYGTKALSTQIAKESQAFLKNNGLSSSMRPALDFRQEIVKVIDCSLGSVSEPQHKKRAPKKNTRKDSKTVEQLRLKHVLAEENRKKRNDEYYKSIKEAAQAKKEIGDLLRPKKNQTFSKRNNPTKTRFIKN